MPSSNHALVSSACEKKIKGEPGPVGPKGDPGPFEHRDRNGTTVIQGEKGDPGPPGYGGERGGVGDDGLRGEPVSSCLIITCICYN